MQPINYLSNAQNPMQSYLEGLKFGQDIRATQEALALDEKKKLFQADLLALQAKPTGNGMLNLMMKYPDFAKSLEPIQKAYSSAEKQGELSQLMQIDNALANGNNQLALDLSNTAKKALTNTGESTEQIDTIIKLITNNDTKGAQGTTSALLASVLGDKYKSYAEAKTIDLKRPSEVLESASKAKSSQVQLEIDISTKQAKIDTLRAKALTAISEAEKADIEAQIAVLTKDLKVDEQKFKTLKSGEEAKQEGIKTLYLEPELKQKIEKGSWDIKKVIEDIGLTKASKQLKYLEIQAEKELNPLRKKELMAKIDGLTTEINSKVNERKSSLNTGREIIDNMTNHIDNLLKNESLNDIVGPRAGYKPVVLMSGKQADANALLETIGSQAFLSQIPAMKGMGALSEKEGEKLQASLSNLGRLQSPEQLRSNLKSVLTIMSKARRNLETKYGVSGDTGITKKTPERPNKKITNEDIDAILNKYGVK